MILLKLKILRKYNMVILLSFRKLTDLKVILLNIFIDDIEGNLWEFEIWILDNIQKYKIKLDDLSYRTQKEKNDIIMKKSLRVKNSEK